jgi:hypothetical protein
MTVANGRTISAKTVHPANTYLARVEVQYWDPTDNTFIPWTGTLAQVDFAEDAAGTVPISGLTAIAMTEVAAVPGTYAAEIPGPTMDNLSGYVGDTVYQIVTIGDSLTDARVVTPLIVRDPRYAQ